MIRILLVFLLSLIGEANADTTLPDVSNGQEIARRLIGKYSEIEKPAGHKGFIMDNQFPECPREITIVAAKDATCFEVQARFGSAYFNPSKGLCAKNYSLKEDGKGMRRRTVENTIQSGTIADAAGTVVTPSAIHIIRADTYFPDVRNHFDDKHPQQWRVIVVLHENDKISLQRIHTSGPGPVPREFIHAALYCNYNKTGLLR